ncbi:MAG: 3-hydroxyacyl-ACP dehydratase FabZ [Proteobacteria bacterium]|nr:3-hydroxyacyl-ACP dehydratase FabZ [Pseudomonadota bacterium]MBU1738607.1 3-hydroxyacyl-ACP dehydratase FabZ [Pseudomonadota bacterium]
MESGKECIDVKKILDLLPHRYPFILVDRILECELGKNIVGLKNVTINEPFFQGHFPGEPVMPGVLILESMAQVGCVLAYLTDQENLSDKIFYFTGLDGARFRKKVVPGDQLIIKVEVVKRKGQFIKLYSEVFVEDSLVAQSGLMAAFG